MALFPSNGCWQARGLDAGNSDSNLGAIAGLFDSKTTSARR
jgi:hypothetical protein